MSDEECQLVDRALGGEEAAAQTIYTAHAGRVKAYFLRSGFGRSDADDLTQEVFFRAFKSLGTFQPQRGALRQWLGAIARNVARRHFSRRTDPESFDPELAEEMFAGGDNPGAGAAAREEFEAVRACVAALPAELGQIVRLRYVEARTTRGIAAVTLVPEATVRLRLKQAMELLARCLKDRGFVE